MLVKEYQRLGSPLQKQSLLQCIKTVEIELSRNTTFNIMPLSPLTLTAGISG